MLQIHPTQLLSHIAVIFLHQINYQINEAQCSFIYRVQTYDVVKRSLLGKLTHTRAYTHTVQTHTCIYTYTTLGRACTRRNSWHLSHEVDCGDDLMINEIRYEIDIHRGAGSIDDRPHCNRRHESERVSSMGMCVCPSIQIEARYLIYDTTHAHTYIHTHVHTETQILYMYIYVYV